MFALSSSAALALWFFIGFESAIIPVEDSTSIKAIKWATIIGTVSASIFYFPGAYVIAGMIPMKVLQHSVSPYADAARIIFGQDATNLIVLSIIMSTLSTANGSLFTQAQVGMSAARDGFFLDCFKQKGRYGTPVKALVGAEISMTLIFLLSWNKTIAEQFNFVTLLSGLGVIIPYFTPVTAELLFLIKGKQDRLSKLKMIITILAVIYAFWMVLV